MNLYVGIDLGTSSVKLMLVDGEGRDQYLSRRKLYDLLSY